MAQVAVRFGDGIAQVGLRGVAERQVEGAGEDAEVGRRLDRVGVGVDAGDGAVVGPVDADVVQAAPAFEGLEVVEEGFLEGFPDGGRGVPAHFVAV
jgi:hypothetical protein